MSAQQSATYKQPTQQYADQKHVDSSADIHIRRATGADIETVLEWRRAVIREVFSLSDDDDITSLMERNRTYYEYAIPDGTHHACFAYLDDRIVGCGGMCLHEEIPSPDNESGYCAYLMNIYTAPDSRGHGVGHAIVHYLIQQAKLAGADKIYLEASPDGRRIYAKEGFVDLPDMMTLNQDDRL